MAEAGFQFVVGDFNFEFAGVDVERDGVAVAHRGDGAAARGLRGDVPRHHPVRRAGETPVGEQRHGLAQSCADDGRRHPEHLAHAGAALRPLVADHDHVARFDAAVLHGGESIFLAIEHAGRAAKLQQVVPGDFDHAAFGREVALEDRQPAVRLEGLIQRPDDRLPRSLFGLLRFFADGLARDGHRVRVQVTAFKQPPGDELNAARIVEVARHKAPARLEVGNERGARADAVEVVNAQFDSGLVGNGEQMEDGVGRAAGGGDAGDGVFNGVAGQDLGGAEVTAEEFHHDLPGGKGKLVFFFNHRRGTVEAHRADAEELHDGGHGIGGELPAARARARTGRVFNLLELRLGDLAAPVCADGLEHILNREVAALGMAGGDRAAVEREAGDVQPGKRHDHAGVGLVAPGDADQRVEMVAARDEFNRVGDDFAADERGLHPLRAHRDPVRNGDRVELQGRAARGADAVFHFGSQPPQVEVARADLDPGVGHAHQRAAQVVVGETHRLEHGPRGRAARAVGDGAAISF